MKKIRIVSDGTAIGTKVYDGDGVDITEGIVSISIGRITHGAKLTATLEYLSPVLEITGLADEVTRYALADAGSVASEIADAVRRGAKWPTA